MLPAKSTYSGAEKVAGGVGGNEKAFAVRGPIEGQQIVPVFQGDRARRLANERDQGSSSSREPVVRASQLRAGCPSQDQMPQK